VTTGYMHDVACDDDRNRDPKTGASRRWDVGKR
jgi:hypothetical protein